MAAYVGHGAYLTKSNLIASKTIVSQPASQLAAPSTRNTVPTLTNAQISESGHTRCVFLKLCMSFIFIRRAKARGAATVRACAEEWLAPATAPVPAYAALGNTCITIEWCAAATNFGSAAGCARFCDNCPAR